MFYRFILFSYIHYFIMPSRDN